MNSNYSVFNPSACIAGLTYLLNHVEPRPHNSGCIDGDRRAQQSLYEHFYGKMLAVCMRYANGHDEALDMFQESFIKVFKNLPKYGKQGSFEGWVRRIMVNTCIDHIRKNKKNNQMVELDDKHGSIQVDQEEDAGILEHVSFSDLIQMVQLLSPAYRSVFNMYMLMALIIKKFPIL